MQLDWRPRCSRQVLKLDDPGLCNPQISLSVSGYGLPSLRGITFWDLVSWSKGVFRNWVSCPCNGAFNGAPRGHCSCHQWSMQEAGLSTWQRRKEHVMFHMNRKERQMGESITIWYLRSDLSLGFKALRFPGAPLERVSDPMTEAVPDLEILYSFPCSMNVNQLRNDNCWPFHRSTIR